MRSWSRIVNLYLDMNPMSTLADWFRGRSDLCSIWHRSSRAFAEMGYVLVVDFVEMAASTSRRQDLEWSLIPVDQQGTKVICKVPGVYLHL